LRLDATNMARETKSIRDSQGRLLAQAEFDNGKLDGTSKVWNAEGVLVEESVFKDGKRHGSYMTRWDNGLPKEEGVFREDKRIGRYVWYSQTGEVMAIHDYGEEGSVI
jgi:antitoxin component YwqK of YwqJK toxin-antitoxin module